MQMHGRSGGVNLSLGRVDVDFWKRKREQLVRWSKIFDKVASAYGAVHIFSFEPFKLEEYATLNEARIIHHSWTWKVALHHVRPYETYGQNPSAEIKTRGEM